MLNPFCHLGQVAHASYFQRWKLREKLHQRKAFLPKILESNSLLQTTLLLAFPKAQSSHSFKLPTDLNTHCFGSGMGNHF